MLKRILTSVITLPFLIFILIYGGLPMSISVAVASLIGLYEFYRVFSVKLWPVQILGYFATIVYFAVIMFGLNISLTLLMVVFVLLLMITMVAFFGKVTIADTSMALFGFCYVPILFSTLIHLNNMANGRFIIWIVFIAAWGSDTGAYFIGVNFGKRKLAPKLSPKKTIEGAVGGVLSALLLAFIYSAILNYFGFISASEILIFTVISGVGAVFSMVGDLSASAIKRYTDTKDFGSILPGHGGILDRFDSVLFTAPLVYILATFFQNLS